MRCPKCRYLSFEPEARCKNCGYDFSFADADAAAPPLQAHGAIHPAAPDSGADPLGDFDFQHLKTSRTPAPTPDGMLFRDPVDPSPSPAAAAPVVQPPTPGKSGAPDTGEAFGDFGLGQLETSRKVISPRSPVPDRVTPPPPSAVLRPARPARIDAPSPRAMAPASSVGPSRPELPKAPPLPAPPRPVSAPAELDLPLFVQSARVPSVPVESTAPAPDPSIEAAESREDDIPLVRVPAKPRAPLGVRRSTPDASRLKAKYGSPSLDLLDLDTDDPPRPPAPAITFDRPPEPAAPPPQSRMMTPVSTARRIGAASLDAVVLGAINFAVCWFTLDVCQLTLPQFLILPLLPLVAFLLLLDGGYLVLFTAACGQTLGKMATGIRVVGTSAEAMISTQVSLGQSIARALVTVLTLGLGLLLGLTGQGRALHDRLAHTRVVQA